MAVMEDRTTLLERFLRLRPPMFHGEYDPDKVESWTHELEHIFETMECAEEGQWFSEVFNGEYFPDYARRERRDQFHALVQDDLTVSQYHQRFVQLLRHVPHVAGSDQACAERFIVGLRPDLRWGVMAHMCTTLGEAVAKATALDRETWQPQQQQQQQGGASSKSSPYQHPVGSRGSATSSSYGSGSFSSAGIRSQFRKLSTRGGGRSRQQKRQSRFAEQLVVQGAEQGGQEAVCYTYGLPGHFRRDCPMGQAPQQQQPYPQQLPQQQQPQQAPQRGHGRGRVMALTREQAEASNLVIGHVLGLSGVGRRRSFLREGPNGVVLHVESPSTVYTSPSPSARHLRACPVREVVTVAWDPHPREPVEGVLQDTSALELAATRRTLELRGKRWLGQWRPCGGHDEQSYGVSDRVYFLYRASCSFASALPFVDFSVAVGHALGGGDGAVVGVPVASSGSPFSVYVTLRIIALPGPWILWRRLRKSGPRRGLRVGFSGRYTSPLSGHVSAVTTPVPVAFSAARENAWVDLLLALQLARGREPLIQSCLVLLLERIAAVLVSDLMLYTVALQAFTCHLLGPTMESSAVRALFLVAGSETPYVRYNHCLARN
ncbi:hypothetical protein Taro_014012 [Colocasia esculenta]|uniref:Retrotransposon gag domain-containing protein n=1 Tax=Colocasia esculenta TaxID=4460 RepID=A0A843U806_COLES|nr:hypothetical protein [Colocasia esculenta]